MIVLISRRLLHKPFLVACWLFFLCGGIALLSRSRMSRSINSIFKSGIGSEYQSWFEHFLPGFASPSLILMVAIPFGAMLLHRLHKGSTTNKMVLRAHKWISAKSEQDLLTLLLGTCAFAYVAASGNYEFHQSLKSGTFQFGQFTCDTIAVVAWFLLLTSSPP